MDFIHNGIDGHVIWGTNVEINHRSNSFVYGYEVTKPLQMSIISKHAIQIIYCIETIPVAYSSTSLSLDEIFNQTISP